jgi:alkanesulfonate monooxygenase SsuD/methylene tetrahydromethanopterin reductase-like flavin-dependent oxidoreductase (luciferase family)
LATSLTHATWSEVARVAEEAGWDGLFTWDHLGFVGGMPTAEPWVTLAAVAATTSRLRLGTWVTPLPRRRIQVVAHQVATLDILSGGRFIFGAGLGGVPEEITAFGEDADLKRRARMFEEGLPLVARLLEGERVQHRGEFYTVDGVQLLPAPLQKPRPPIWIGAISAPARRRAADWEGWTVPNVDISGRPRLSPDAIGKQIEAILARRTAQGPFDVAITGASEAGETTLVREFAGAGVTWWLETLHGRRFSPEQALRRVAAGPPRF